MIKDKPLIYYLFRDTVTAIIIIIITKIISTILMMQHFFLRAFDYKEKTET